MAKVENEQSDRGNVVDGAKRLSMENDTAKGSAGRLPTARQVRCKTTQGLREEDLAPIGRSYLFLAKILSRGVLASSLLCTHSCAPINQENPVAQRGKLGYSGSSEDESFLVSLLRYITSGV